MLNLGVASNRVDPLWPGDAYYDHFQGDQLRFAEGLALNERESTTSAVKCPAHVMGGWRTS